MLDIDVVRTIVILGTFAIHFGDLNIKYTLWPVAIRIGQALKLNDDAANLGESLYQGELRRRLWWSLTTNDWLSIQLGPYCIRSDDFSVALPADVPEAQLQAGVMLPHTSIEPIQYGIALAQISRIVYRFTCSMKRLGEDGNMLKECIRTADEELANVINDLPAHLTADEPETRRTLERDAAFPWIPNQKRSIATIMLYYRTVINRVAVRSAEARDLVQQRMAMAVCLDSSHALVRIGLTENDPSHLLIW